MVTNITSWLRLFRSPTRTVKIRAASALLQYHSDELPLGTLLEILDELSHEGLGAAAERVLYRRRDPDLLGEMVRRLQSADSYLREVACSTLGRLGDPAATQHLLRALSDPVMMVRRAAGFGLAFLKDPNSIPTLLQRYKAARNDDINVRFAIESALNELGVSYTRHPW